MNGGKIMEVAINNLIEGQAVEVTCKNGNCK